MGYRTLELTVISAKDLKNVNWIGKMDVYVIVSLFGDPCTMQTTPVHQDGGTKPSWNYTMRFIVDEAAAAQSDWPVVFQLRHEHTLGPDKDLGEVRVSVKEFIEGFANKKDGRFVTYPIRMPCGEPKGELNFSYKLTDVADQQKGFLVVEAYPPQVAYAQPQGPHGGYTPQQPGGHGYQSGHGPPGSHMQGQVPQIQKKNGGVRVGMRESLLGGALGALLTGNISEAYKDCFYSGAADSD